MGRIYYAREGLKKIILVEENFLSPKINNNTHGGLIRPDIEKD